MNNKPPLGVRLKVIYSVSRSMFNAVRELNKRLRAGQIDLNRPIDMNLRIIPVQNVKATKAKAEWGKGHEK